MKISSQRKSSSRNECLGCECSYRENNTGIGRKKKLLPTRRSTRLQSKKLSKLYPDISPLFLTELEVDSFETNESDPLLVNSNSENRSSCVESFDFPLILLSNTNFIDNGEFSVKDRPSQSKQDYFYLDLLTPSQSSSRNSYENGDRNGISPSIELTNNEVFSAKGDAIRLNRYQSSQSVDDNFPSFLLTPLEGVDALTDMDGKRNKQTSDTALSEQPSSSSIRRSPRLSAKERVVYFPKQRNVNLAVKFHPSFELIDEKLSYNLMASLKIAEDASNGTANLEERNRSKSDTGLSEQLSCSPIRRSPRLAAKGHVVYFPKQRNANLKRKSPSLTVVAEEVADTNQPSEVAASEGIDAETFETPETPMEDHHQIAKTPNVPEDNVTKENSNNNNEEQTAFDYDSDATPDLTDDDNDSLNDDVVRKATLCDEGANLDSEVDLFLTHQQNSNREYIKIMANDLPEGITIMSPLTIRDVVISKSNTTESMADTITITSSLTTQDITNFNANSSKNELKFHENAMFSSEEQRNKTSNDDDTSRIADGFVIASSSKLENISEDANVNEGTDKITIIDEQIIPSSQGFGYEIIESLSSSISIDKPQIQDSTFDCSSPNIISSTPVHDGQNYFKTPSLFNEKKNFHPSFHHTMKSSDSVIECTASSIASVDQKSESSSIEKQNVLLGAETQSDGTFIFDIEPQNGIDDVTSETPPDGISYVITYIENCEIPRVEHKVQINTCQGSEMDEIAVDDDSGNITMIDGSVVEHDYFILSEEVCQPSTLITSATEYNGVINGNCALSIQNFKQCDEIFIPNETPQISEGAIDDTVVTNANGEKYLQTMVESDHLLKPKETRQIRVSSLKSCLASFDSETVFEEKRRLVRKMILKRRAKFRNDFDRLSEEEILTAKYVDKLHVNMFEDLVDALLDKDYVPDFDRLFFPICGRGLEDTLREDVSIGKATNEKLMEIVEKTIDIRPKENSFSDDDTSDSDCSGQWRIIQRRNWKIARRGKLKQ